MQFGLNQLLPELLNKKNNRLLDFITHPLFLSIIISSIIIYTLPPIFNKYKAEILNENREIKKQLIYYANLDNDIASDKIVIDLNYLNMVGVRVFKNNRLIEQWNLDGRFLETLNYFWYDIDNDGYKELFIFTVHDNKIFLNCISPITKKLLFKNRPVADFEPLKINLEYYGQVIPCGFFNNRNGQNVFYFVISEGFPLYPRKLFAYNTADDSLYRSGESHADIVHMIVSNSGNNLDFITATEAVGNFKEKDPYTDLYSWLMDFNEDLSFRYNPIKIGYYPSHSDIVNFEPEKSRYYVVTNSNYGDKDHQSTLTIYNTKLEKIREKQFTNNVQDRVGVRLYYDAKNKPDNFFLMREDGNIEKLNSQLNVIDSTKLPSITNDFYPLDLDGDGKDELIYQTKDMEHIVIARNDFSDYILVKCPDAGYIQHCSLKLDGKNRRQLFVQFDNAALTINYGFNPLSYLRYPLYAGIYLSVFLLMLLIQKTQRHRVELKYNTEKEIAELQMRSIKNQVDPHFTLNILNSIGSLFYKRNNERADYVFGKYSKLLRSMVLNSDKIITTLSEELEYVKDYLDLELFRYDNRFNYELKIEKDVDLNITIPKMLVHTFAENAVKHGLRHLEKDGKLLIKVYSFNGNSNILIRDNGIGREEAKKIELDNTGKGLKIIDQILDLYYSLMHKKLEYTVRDIFNADKTSAGTEVLVEIPKN